MAPGIADKKNNSLPLWGNEKTMNLNNLILTNILSSHYFKVNLYQLKTYHEVIDEIFYQVTHLEPWEKGSRKTSGQTGMCGGVRGVGAGGIVSTAFCILYKLFTLKLTRKQVVGLINHADSPYIRALGFMYIRYTQPPVDLWDWYEPYLEDEEEIDVKAGSGQVMTMGEMLRHFLSKLEWFSTLFPRIPVPIQKDLERKLSDWRAEAKIKSGAVSQDIGELAEEDQEQHLPDEEMWEDDSAVGRSTEQPEFKMKDSTEESKETNKSRLDVADEISKEKERQRREKHGNTSKHLSNERYKEYSSHSSRARSRSPTESRSYRTEEIKKHKTKHREKERSSDYARHKVYSNSQSKPHKKEFSSSEYDRLSKERLHNYDRKDEKRGTHSHSHNHEKKHKHSSSRTRH